MGNAFHMEITSLITGVRIARMAYLVPSAKGAICVPPTCGFSCHGCGTSKSRAQVTRTRSRTQGHAHKVTRTRSRAQGHAHNVNRMSRSSLASATRSLRHDATLLPCRRPPRLPYFAGRFFESFVCILHARLPSFMVYPGVSFLIDWMEAWHRA